MKPLRLISVFVLVLTAWIPARACTIFVLTDESRTLFFNNEDWFNPSTRLWFVPAAADHLGCAYIGFDNGWAQGGVNTAGLAFDWVSGFEENYQADSASRVVRGNPSERMLESCSTVEEAITFYRTHLEPDFARSRILIADRSGTSVVIGSKAGQLHIVPLRGNRGFGYGQTALEQALAKSPAPTVANGMEILRACLQPGDGGTKYSNVYNLRSGEIIVYSSPGDDAHVSLNLADELAKGGHYYDIPKIRDQIAASPRPLLSNQRRFYLDEFSPVADGEPDITARVSAMIQGAAAGALREADFAPAFWEKIADAQKDIHAELQQLGPFISLALVDRGEDPAGRSYRYLVEFDRARVLARYVLDTDGKIALMQSEFAELKSSFTAK